MVDISLVVKKSTVSNLVNFTSEESLNFVGLRRTLWAHRLAVREGPIRHLRCEWCVIPNFAKCWRTKMTCIYTIQSIVIKWHHIICYVQERHIVYLQRSIWSCFTFALYYTNMLIESLRPAPQHHVERPRKRRNVFSLRPRFYQASG